MIPFFILLFWIITFGASTLEKLFHFKNTLFWLSDYLKHTPFVKILRPILIFILFSEAIATFFCGLGLGIFIFSEKNEVSTASFLIFSEIGISIGIATLLCFLIGQRFAKDYEGARGMTLYIFAGIISLFLLNHF